MNPPGSEQSGPLSYETPGNGEQSSRPPDGRAAGLCIIAASILALAGAVALGLSVVATAMNRSPNDAEPAGVLMLLAAGVLLVFGFVRWIRSA